MAYCFEIIAFTQIPVGCFSALFLGFFSGGRSCSTGLSGQILRGGWGVRFHRFGSFSGGGVGSPQVQFGQLLHGAVSSIGLVGQDVRRERAGRASVAGF